MFNRFFGLGPDEAKVLGPRFSGRKALFGGVALSALAGGATGAAANCSSNLPAFFGINTAGLVPLASGGAVPSLISAINTSNTAFLTQSTAFIGSPPDPQPNQLGGGVWGRGIGGQFTTRNTTSGAYSLLGTNGQIDCNTTTRLDFAGYQVGTDVAHLNWNGWNLHLGGTLGYMGAIARDVSGAGPIDPQGGTLQNVLEAPFVGFYGAATYGGFFIDGQVRWNYYQNQLNDPVQNGLFGQRLDARGVSLNANVGYNYRLYENWFVEPSAGVVYSRTSVDPLNVPGTLVTNVTGSLSRVALPGTISISEIISTLGRLSLRGGTSFDAGNVVLQPFATASVFHDFEGGQSASLSASPASLGLPFPDLAGKLAITNLGTYGQFGVGTVAQLKDTGWLAYLRGDYRTGSKIEGWSVNGGVRYQFTPQPTLVTARSADVAVPVPVPYDWTGLYVGGFLGADWGWTDWRFVDNSRTVNPRFAGLLGGGGLGYNYQTGKVVFGLEGDFGWTNAKGARPCPNMFFFGCESDVNWLSTVTGRFGLAYFDRLLWYLKGGLALGQVKAAGRCNTDSQITLITGSLLNPDCPTQSTTRTAAGWTIGAGSEFALTDNWSAKAELSFFDLGTARYTFGLLGGSGADINRHGFISRVGINYHFTDLFGPPPVVATY